MPKKSHVGKTENVRKETKESGKTLAERLESNVQPLVGATVFGLGFWYFNGIPTLIEVLNQVTQLGLTNSVFTQIIGSATVGILSMAAVSAAVIGGERILKAPTLEKENGELQVKLNQANQKLSRAQSNEEKALNKREARLFKQLKSVAKKKEELKKGLKDLETQKQQLLQDQNAFKIEQNAATKKNHATAKNLRVKEQELIKLQADLEAKQTDLSRRETALVEQEAMVAQQLNAIKGHLFSDEPGASKLSDDLAPQDSFENDDAPGAPLSFRPQQEISAPVSPAAGETALLGNQEETMHKPRKMVH